jgi:Na+-translocating ferredoxin:NAD+ oxidoreductase RnfC subunit
MREFRKVAPSRVMARMGLQKLYANKPDGFLELGSDTVSIPLKQHIGAPAEAVVAKGDRVACGQLIARLAEGKPSANVHASISGLVTQCGDHITIKGGG